MDYETLIENLVFWSKAFHVNPQARGALEKAAKAITDLLSRAEVAEARCKAFEKMAREYQNIIVPEYRERAEKAERQRDVAVRDIESMMAYGDKLNTCHFCKNVQCHERGGTKPCLPKWYQEEE